MVALSWFIIMGWMLPCRMSLCFVKGCSGEEKGPEQQQLTSQASLPTDGFPLSVWRGRQNWRNALKHVCAPEHAHFYPGWGVASGTGLFFVIVTICYCWVWGLGLSRIPTSLTPVFPSMFDWSRMYTLAISCSTSARKTRHLPVKFSVWIPQDP